jgi:phosphoribosyl 1,2-cyclic phosphodiesterase
LFSSSKGNSYYVGGKTSGVLIDCGVSARNIVNSLALNNISVEAVRAIFITHEHVDHVRGLSVFLRNRAIPVFCTKGTAEMLSRTLSGADIRVVTDITELHYLDFTADVRVIKTSHDAAEPCGWRFNFDSSEQSEKSSLAFITDTGLITDAIRAIALGAQNAVLESNYDTEMLRFGSYPPYIKARIAGRDGHLSNTQSADFSRELVSAGCKQLLLAHLSENNNTPERAYKAAVEGIGAENFINGSDYFLKVLPPVCGTWFCGI